MAIELLVCNHFAKMENIELPSYESTQHLKNFNSLDTDVGRDEIRNDHEIVESNQSRGDTTSENCNCPCGFVVCLIVSILLITSIILMGLGETLAEKDYENYKRTLNNQKLQEAISISNTFEECSCTLQQITTSTLVECQSGTFTTYHESRSGDSVPFTCFKMQNLTVIRMKQDWIDEYVHENGEHGIWNNTWICPIRTLTWVGIPLFIISVFATVVACSSSDQPQ